MEILIFSFTEEKQPLRHHEGESSSKYSRQYTFREELHLSPIPLYKVVQIWPGLFVCKQAGYSPGHIWTTLYLFINNRFFLRTHGSI